MRILDLFCGAGGAAMGLHQAFPEATIIGVDKKHQGNYPFNFVQGDAIEFIESASKCSFVGGSRDEYPQLCDSCGKSYLDQDHLIPFDFVWASPVCHAHSRLNAINKRVYESFIPRVRGRLVFGGVPWVIENVVGAPLHKPRMLCGQMFGLKVFRHRLFESSFPWDAPIHMKHNGATGTHRWPYKPINGYVQVTGSGSNFTISQASKAMGIDWMNTKLELSQAIPPAYSRYIGEQFKLWLASHGESNQEK